MNLPMAIPEVQFFERDEYPCERVSMTPYTNLDWQGIVQEHSVSIPEKFRNIVTLVDGKSVCSHCGAVYAGKQWKCTAMVDYHSDKDSGNNSYVKSNLGFKQIGALTGGYPGPRRVVKVYKDKCNQNCRWDLEHEFSEQTRFYNFLQRLPVDYHSDWAMFAGTLKDPKQVEIIYLRSYVVQLRMDVDWCKGAIQQMAQKMNSAGHALAF